MVRTESSGNVAPRMGFGAALSFVLCVVACVSLVAALDVFAAGLLLHGLVALILPGFFALGSLLLVLRHRRRWMQITAALAALSVVVLLVAPWHPRKRFAMDLHSIQPGMTVAAVDAVMQRYLPGMGRKWEAAAGGPALAEDFRHVLSGTLTWRWNDTDAVYDSDFGQVTFVRGRVVQVEFLPD